MKILFASSLYGISGGGAGLITERLARAFYVTGNAVSIATVGDSRKPVLMEQNGIRIYSFCPTNIYNLKEKDTKAPWRKMIWQLVDLYNPLVRNVFLDIFTHEKPDVIHIHKMRGFSSAVWSVAAEYAPGRVIQSCHDYESISPDGLLRGWVGRMALRKNWPVRGYQLIRGRLSAGISVVTAPSYITLQRIQKSGLFPSARACVVANTHGWTGEDLQALTLPDMTSPQDRIRFLFIGRLEKEKGIIELCNAFLRAYAKNKDLSLEIAGWGSLDTELHEKFGGHPAIKLLGLVQATVKEDVIRRSTVVCVPSLVEEVFGMVVIESFALGKPVIATNIGGLPELIRHNETGWLVEPYDTQSLADRLLSISSLPHKKLREMGQTCKRYAYDFSLDKISGEYLKLYNQLLG